MYNRQTGEAVEADIPAEDEDELQFQESQEARGPPIELEAPLIDRLGKAKAKAGPKDS